MTHPTSAPNSLHTGPGTLLKPGEASRVGPGPRCSAAIAASPVVRVPAGSGGSTATAWETDLLAQEAPVALEYNGISHTTLMASPIELEDLALGFSLTEGILRSASDLHDIEVVETAQGYLAQMTIASACFNQLKQHRRTLAGRTGCGLCGVESLDQVVRPLYPVANPRQPVPAESIKRAMRALRSAQPVHQQTGATHAAAWADLEGTLLHVREDVGRHNALDKLIGRLKHRRHEVDTTNGFVLLSSRASFEMVQKSAAAGISVVVAVSAPTQFAVRTAQELNVLLAGFARNDAFNVYSHYQHLC